MDFHALSRKQLQALCKKNKIPANMTNVAMADSLAALEQVEGIEEFLNPVDTDAQKFPYEKGVGTPACRTSTRRKPVMEEPESSNVSTRVGRGTRVKNDEEIDQGNKDLNVPLTPAAPTTRRRAAAASTRRKKEDEKPTDHVTKTPAASNSRVKATSAYNTRRSVRLLEKGLCKMNLMDNEETGSVYVGAISEALSSVYQQMECSEDTENGASSLATSTEVTEKTDESELNSSAKNLSEVRFVDVDETESVKVDEISEEVTDPPQKIEEIEDAVEVYDAGANSQIMSIELIEETDELELTSSEKKTEIECQSNNSNSEIPLVSEEASDTGANLQAEPQESLMEINKSGSPFQDMNNSSESDVELTESNATEVNDAINESDTGNDIQSSALTLSSQAENEAVVEMDGELAEIHVSKVDDEVDACMMVVENNNKLVESAYDNQNSEESFSAENKAVETACDIQNPEGMFFDEEKVVEADEMGFKTSSDIEESKEDVEDAVMEVCNESLSSEGNTNVQILADSLSSEGNTNAQGVADSQSPLVTNEDKVESETTDVPSSLVRNEAEAESETTNDQGVADSQSPLVTNETKAESETADVQSSLDGNEAEAESETTDMQSAADSESPLVTNEAKSESETADVQSSLDRNEPEALSETTDMQSVVDSQSPLVTNEAKSESETADVQSSLVGNEPEAESETTVPIDNEEDCKDNADVPTVTVAPASSEQKPNDVPIQFVYQDQSAPKNNAAVEVKSVTITKMSDEEGDKRKQNQINDDLTSKSMRQLKKMLKNSSLENKINNDKNSNSVVKEVGRKRTALQEVPENRMAASKGQPLLP